ncbi:transcriptional regulator, LysR family [Paracoccus halophilus]|uniref:Transcriptional regulator, LysR family n=1 Tax=Paracoccus halophilus TaxID=376733 RepID=A0A1I0U964_9RHOB|nr:LysR substrate-binding domain-containing protein [Paracoccus halophilus]SFA60564.1 transcriptional regulator, LysR family [Paracoccus halophilus]
MRELPHLVYLQAFEAAARHLNFTRAAEELNCTQAAISQRVRALEHYFGRPLFKRQSNGLDLSSAGKAYLPGVSQALDMAEAATRGLTGRRERRAITISGPISFLNLWIAPRLHAFQARHPGVGVQLNSSIWTDPNIDLADVSFAFEKRELSSPEATILATQRLVLVTSPDQAAQLAQGAPWQDLPQIEILGKYSLWDMWSKGMGQHRAASAPLLRVDTAISALELAAAGAGVTILYSTYAQAPQAFGRVQAPLGPGVAVPHVLTMNRNAKRKETEALRSFMTWVSDELTTVE